MGVIDGIINGVASLVGSGLNAYGTNQTNQTNKEIAQMNNETMINLMREQTRADQTYNSIGEQMKRAVAAGVNPMTMAGAQPTSVSAAPVPNLDTPVMQNPFTGFDVGGTAFTNAMVQTKSLENQSKALDIQDFESTTELLRVVGDLAKSGNLTSSDINDLISKFLPADRQSTLGPLVQDQFIKTKFSNAVENSNLDTKEKKYLFGWLDEFTNARYIQLLADTENTQTGSNVNRSKVSLNSSQEKLNKSLASMNDEKAKEIRQAIKNMEEQWKSLNFQGELDASKLKDIPRYTEALIAKLESETNLSAKESQMLVLNWAMKCLIPWF